MVTNHTTLFFIFIFLDELWFYELILELLYLLPVCHTVSLLILSVTNFKVHTYANILIHLLSNLYILIPSGYCEQNMKYATLIYPDFTFCFHFYQQREVEFGKINGKYIKLCKKTTLKIKVQVNGSTDPSETHINCVEHTQLCVQKDLFSSFKAIKRKIFYILNVKISTLHINQSFLNRIYVEYNPTFLVIWKVAHFQFLFN
jgi:hypothetical protein